MIVPSERVVAFLRALIAPPKRSRAPEDGGGLDALIALFAGLVCLFFVGTLRDVPAAREVPRGPLAALSAPPGDGRVKVHVVDEKHAPVENAIVRAFSIVDDRARLGGEQKSPASGDVVFGELPRTETWIVAYGEGKTRASTSLALGPEPRDVELVLADASALEAKVVDGEGKPISGIEVRVTANDPLPNVAVSDADGKVLFDRLGPAPYTVTVDVPGFDPVKKSGVFPGPDPLVIRLERLGGFEVHVTTPEGDDAIGATVFISGPGIWPARSTETDEDGVARIAGLRTGVYDLKARQGELVSKTDLSVPVKKGVFLRRELALSDGEMVRVHVTDGAGANGVDAPPIEDAKVSLVEEGLSSFPLEAKTDKNGDAMLGPVATPNATILARADGFVARSVSRTTEKDGVVTIALEHGGVISGDVRDARGYPIDGASIEVLGTDEDGMPIDLTGDTSTFGEDLFAFSLAGPVALIPRGELGVMPGPIPDIPRENGAPAAPATGKGGEPWVSALDGTFRASPVTPGRVRLLVTHPSYVEQQTEVATLAPGGELVVHVVMQAGGRLEGRVLEESRLPVAGARIEIAATEGTFEALTYTADDGTFAIASVPDEVAITVTRAEDPTEIATRLVVDVPPNDKREIEIVLPKVRDAVALRVLDDRRQGVERAEVRVTSLDPETVLAKTLFTDEDGRAELPNAVGLPLRVVVEHPGSAPHAFTVPSAGVEETFTIEAGRTLRGKVTAREGRDKVAGADLTLYTATGARHATSDEDGAFEVKDLAEGRIRIVTVAEGYARGEHIVFLQGDERRPIDIAPIDLSASGTVEGLVVDAGGQAVAGARVAMDTVPTYLPIGKLPAGIAQTDHDGKFTLGELPEGVISLEAYSPDLGRGDLDGVEIRAGRTTDRVVIEIPDQDYQPRDPHGAGNVAVTLADRDGAVVIVAVPPGSEAEYAGLEPDDVLAGVGGNPVRDAEQARDRLGGPITHDVIVDIDRSNGSGTDRIRLRVRREAVRR